MSRFPLFIDLAGRRAVVIGGGTVGLRRAAALRDFGAVVTVISPTLSGPMPDVIYLPRPYRTGDLAGAFLVVAATDDSAVNAAADQSSRQDTAYRNNNLFFHVLSSPEIDGAFLINNSPSLIITMRLAWAAISES